MRLQTASLCALAMAAAAFQAQAQAQQASVGHIDAFYIPSADVELSDSTDSIDDDGDGFGFRGRFQVADQLFLAAEYQAIDTDDFDFEVDQLRLGIGFVSSMNSSVTFVGQVEYVDAEVSQPILGSTDEDGFGIHAGLELDLTPQFSIHGSVGFISLGDTDGPEFLVGARYQVTPVISVLIDYRATRLSDSGVDLDLDDLRLGAGFHF